MTKCPGRERRDGEAEAGAARKRLERETGMSYGYHERATSVALVNGARSARNRGCRSLTNREFRDVLFPRLFSRGSIEASPRHLERAPVVRFFARTPVTVAAYQIPTGTRPPCRPPVWARMSSASTSREILSRRGTDAPGKRD